MPDDQDDYQLAMDDDQPAGRPDTRCQQCGHTMPPDTILCSRCGYNHQTGKTVSKGPAPEVDKKDEEESPFYDFLMKLASSDIPIGKIIFFGLFVLICGVSYAFYSSTVGFSHRIEAVQPGTAHVVLDTGERQGPMQLDLRELAENPDKPGGAIKSPFGNLGLTGDLDNRFTLGGSDKLVLFEPVPAKMSRDVLIRLTISQSVLLENGLKSMDEVILKGEAFTLDFGDGRRVPGLMLGWVLDNPATINVSSAQTDNGGALVPVGCKPSETKMSRADSQVRGLLGPKVGVYTFQGDEDCTGVFRFEVPPPSPGVMAMGAMGFQNTEGKLDINTTFGKPITVLYQGSAMAVRYPETARGWWSLESKYRKTAPYGIQKEQIVLLFKRPPRGNRTATLYVRDARLGTVDTMRSTGQIMLARDAEREEEQEQEQDSGNGPMGLPKPF